MEDREKHSPQSIARKLKWFEAITLGGREAFGQLLEGTRPLIRRIASNYFDDPQAVEDAISVAFEKAIQVFSGLDMEGIAVIRDPQNYFLTTMHHAITDYFKGSKEEDASTDIEGLRWVDETIPTGEDESDNGGFGWRTFGVKEEKRRKPRDEWEAWGDFEYQRSLFDQKLWAFYKYYKLGRFSSGYDLSTYVTVIKKIDRAYRHSKLMVSTMPGEIAKRVITLYLSGYTVTQIATRLQMPKGNVSREIKRWLRIAWRWDEYYIELVKTAWLLYALADIYLEPMSKRERREWEHEARCDVKDGHYTMVSAFKPWGDREFYGAVKRAEETAAGLGNLEEGPEERNISLLATVANAAALGRFIARTRKRKSREGQEWQEEDDWDGWDYDN